MGYEGSSDCELFVDLQFAKAILRLQTWRQLSNAVPSMPSPSAFRRTVPIVLDYVGNPFC
jgi:hypothetical protein